MLISIDLIYIYKHTYTYTYVIIYMIFMVVVFFDTHPLRWTMELVNCSDTMSPNIPWESPWCHCLFHPASTNQPEFYGFRAALEFHKEFAKALAMRCDLSEFWFDAFRVLSFRVLDGFMFWGSTGFRFSGFPGESTDLVSCLSTC